MRNSLLVSLAALAISLGACANTRAPVEVETGNPFGSYLSARVASAQHDLATAAKLYRASLDGDPTNPEIANRAFLYTAAAGDVDGAIDLANKVVANSPDDRAARLALAIGALKQGDYSDARTQLSQSAKGPFTTLTLSLVNAWASVGAGDYDAALKQIDASKAEGGSDPLAAFHRALILDLAGRDGDADAAYQQALQLTNSGPRVVEAYGRFLERHDRAADARALYEKIGTDDTLAPIAKEGLARLAAGTKPDRLVNTPQAGAAEGLFTIAASLTDATSADIAILYLRFALYLNPDFDMAKIVLADRFEALKKFEDAIAVYRSVDAASAYAPAVAIQIAVDEGRLDRKDEAIADLKKIADTHQDDLSVWSSLGDAYRADSKDEDAIAAYTHAIKLLNPPTKKDWPLFFARAASEQNLKNWTDAETDLKTALKLSPDEPQVLNFLGYSWVDQGRNLPEALAMLEKARALSPYDGYIVDSVGWAYYRLKRYQDAATTLEAAVLLVPGDSTINEHLGDAYWMAGRRLDARFQWNHALAFGPDPKAKVELERKLKDGLDAAQAGGGD